MISQTHGPRLRGIERVEELGPKHVIGWVRPSRPCRLRRS